MFLKTLTNPRLSESHTLTDPVLLAQKATGLPCSGVESSNLSPLCSNSVCGLGTKCVHVWPRIYEYIDDTNGQKQMTLTLSGEVISWSPFRV